MPFIEHRVTAAEVRRHTPETLELRLTAVEMFLGEAIVRGWNVRTWKDWKTGDLVFRADTEPVDLESGTNFSDSIVMAILNEELPSIDELVEDLPGSGESWVREHVKGTVVDTEPVEYVIVESLPPGRGIVIGLLVGGAVTWQVAMWLGVIQ